MKIRLLLFLVTLAGFRAFADTTVAITAEAMEDFTATPSFSGAVGAFQQVSPFGGLGWEVAFDHVGLGGSYFARFFQRDSGSWWMDWYGDGIYLSAHLLGAGAAIDPFVRAGLGCAGRVFLRGDAGASSTLEISLFPVLTAGASLRFGILSLGAHLDLIPYANPVPVTTIPPYGLGRFQVGVFAGFILG
ncbi:MAG TPA: hypothetical protein VMC79_06310 [Rectinemataceae bacterium]|nr:hypothetical protein [Rectinemataceae bacterium]